MSHIAVTSAGFFLGILVIALGLFISPLVGGAENNAETAVELTDGDTEEIQQNLEVALNATTGSNVTVEVTNLRTFATNETAELDVDETETLRLSGANVTVTHRAHDASSGESILDVEYPPTFGYDSSLQVFYEDALAVILTLVGLLMALGAVFIGVFDAG